MILILQKGKSWARIKSLLPISFWIPLRFERCFGQPRQRLPKSLACSSTGAGGGTQTLHSKKHSTTEAFGGILVTFFSFIWFFPFPTSQLLAAQQPAPAVSGGAGNKQPAPAPHSRLEES